MLRSWRRETPVGHADLLLIICSPSSFDLTVLEPKELSNPCGGDSHFELAIKALLWVTATTRCSVSMTSYGQFGPQGTNSLYLQCLGRLFKWAQWSHGEKNQSGKCNDKCWPALGITGGDKETEGGCGGWKKVGSILKGQPPLGSYYWLPCENVSLFSVPLNSQQVLVVWLDTQPVQSHHTFAQKGPYLL